jgi:hypothetical protein
MNELVQRLSEGDHPIEAGISKTVKEFKESIDRGYVHIRFTATRGGTNIGVRLNKERSDFSKADFEKGIGEVHIVGFLVLNYVKVNCVADLNLEILKGTGHLEIIEEVQPGWRERAKETQKAG